MTTKAKASTAKPAAEAAAETIETINSVGQETLKNVMNIGADAAAEGYKNASAYGKEQMDVAKISYDKLMSYGKDNIEAVEAASSVAVAGAEAYYASMVDYTKKAAAENMDLLQKSFAVRNPQELMDLQVEAVNTSVNRVIAQTTRLNKIAADTAVKSFEPIKGRFDGAVESFVKPFVSA